jgi:predicted  nucleic acid-binding Zn-ribbon protein
MIDQEAITEDPIKARQNRITELNKAKKQTQSASVAVAYKKEIAALKNEITQLQSGGQP